MPVDTQRDPAVPRKNKQSKQASAGTPAVAKMKQRVSLEKLADEIKRAYRIEPVGRDPLPIAYISTGYQALDDVLSGRRDGKDRTRIVPGSGKGFPRGRIVEIYGPEAAAKTTLALAVIASAQRNGETCAFLDVEHALDLDYAVNAIGVAMDPSSLLLYDDIETGEDAVRVLVKCVKAGVSVIVLDSVAALFTEAQREGKRALGEQARLMSEACREITSYLRAGGPTVIFINQIRYKIGVMFGNPEMTTGGNALKFYASVRVEVRKQKDLKKAGEVKGEPVVVGQRIRLYVKKNKVAPAHGSALFDVLLGEGIRIPRLNKRKQADDGE